MPLVTVIWSATAGACLTLALVHLLLWCWNRESKASLWFAGVALSVAVMAYIESAIMHVEVPAEFYSLHRRGHVTFFVTIVCVVGFIQSYFGSGRRWLIGSLIGLRALILLLAFVPGPTFNFKEVSAMVPVTFLGGQVRIPLGSSTAWEPLANLSGLLLVAFVVDASVRLWRGGESRERQRAVVVASGVVMFVVSCATNGLLVHHGLAQVPYFITLSFLFVIAAMEVELSRDLLHTARLAAEVRENAESMRLAASAGQLALWRWDIPNNSIWVSPGGRELYGIQPEEAVTLDRFLETIHQDDRELTSRRIGAALKGGGPFHSEYRVSLPDGGLRWINARGKTEFDGNARPSRMRGVSIDITLRVLAEQEASQHRAELAHLTRVTTLNELSGSLAHELYQPLAIILSNAQAAQRLLSKAPPDLQEVEDILVDIVAEDRRATELIERLRTLFKRGESTSLPVSLNEAVDDVLRLAQSDLSARGITITCSMPESLPQVSGDRVQLQQVLLNLLLNAADAMSAKPPGKRLVHLSAEKHDQSVRVSVRDEGCGLPEDAARVFHPFFTTKQDGLGLGLAISRAIISAHGGRLWAESPTAGGAVFHFEIPELRMNAR